MPFSVGGGISSIEDIKDVIACGAEKVILNSHAITNPLFIQEAVQYFGSSTIVLCIDVKKKFLGKSNYVLIRNGKEATKYKPVEHNCKQNMPKESIFKTSTRRNC